MQSSISRLEYRVKFPKPSMQEKARTAFVPGVTFVMATSVYVFLPRVRIDVLLLDRLQHKESLFPNLQINVRIVICHESVREATSLTTDPVSTSLNAS